jgi:hypothetical protein
MALIPIMQGAFPSYIALSTDISNSTIPGIGWVGSTVFLSDSSAWYVIKSDLTLEAFSLPINSTSAITIGIVSQGAAGVSPWLVSDDGPTWTATHTVTNSADMSSLVNVSGLPTSGQKLVFTDIVISCGTAMTVTLKEETSGTVFGGPYYMAANTTLVLRPRSRMFKLATINKHLQAIASVSGNITVETWAFSEA